MNRKLYRRVMETRVDIDPATGKEHKRVVYVGAFYRLTLSADEWNGTRVRLLLLFIAQTVALAVAAFLNNDGSRCFYVLPLFLCCFFPLLYEALALLALRRVAPDKLNEIERREGFESLSNASHGVMVCAALTTVGDVVLLFVGVSSLWRELLFLLCSVLCLAASAVSGHMASWLLKRIEPLPK